MSIANYLFHIINYHSPGVYAKQIFFIIAIYLSTTFGHFIYGTTDYIWQNCYHFMDVEMGFRINYGIIDQSKS